MGAVSHEHATSPPSRLPTAVAVALALASAVAAVTLSGLLFPHLSINNDEPIYRLHADAIAHGHLFPPAPSNGDLADAFRPWLAAVSDDHYVLKYHPAVPSLIAVSQLTTGGPWLFLAGTSAAAVFMTYLLAREVLGHDWDALLAAAIVALSPLMLVQSALLLAYVTSFVLLETFCWGLLRARNTGKVKLLAVSGLALGAAFVVRPYDAVLFAPPLLLWAVWSWRGAERPAWSWYRAVAIFVGPATLAAAGFFVYNATVTGSALQPSFSLLESQDTLGFGVRRLYPTDEAHDFGLRQGIEGVVHHGRLLTTWLVGGLILFALAAVALLRRRGGSVGPWLAASAVMIPVGYLFFWGPWNATLLWGGTRFVGPFYFLPMLIPVAILGGRGLGDLGRTRTSLGVVAGVAMLALSAPTLVRIIDDNAGFDRQSESLAELVDHGDKHKLVLTPTPTPYLMHPSPVIANNWDLSNSNLFAIESPERDLDVVAAFPERTPYRLFFDDELIRPEASLVGQLEELRVATAERLSLRVVVRPAAGGGRLALAVTAAGVRRTYELDGRPGPDPRYDEALTVDASGASITGRTAVSESPDNLSGLVLTLLQWTESTGTPVTVAERRLPLRLDGRVTTLVPVGRSWTAGRLLPPRIEVMPL